MSNENEPKIPEMVEFEVLPSVSPNAVAIFEYLNILKSRKGGKEIEKRRLINETETQFFLTTAINAIEMSTTLFRKNESANRILSTSWLSIVNEKAKRIALTDGIRSYASIGENELRQVARQSIAPEEIRRMPEFLATNFGIILIIEVPSQA